MTNRRKIFMIAGVVVLLVGVGALLANRGPDPVDDEITLSEFNELAADGEIDEATIFAFTTRVDGTLTDDSTFRMVYAAPELVPDIVAALEDAPNSPEFQADRSNSVSIIGIALSLLPMLFLGAIAYVVIKQFNGGRSIFRRSDLADVKHKPKVTFDDIAGLDEAVEELGEIREFLSEPKKFEQLGADIPRGVLLYGPPGTGKTLLAQALAGEAGVPFFSLSGSNFVEMFAGRGAARVRGLFKEAKRHAPAIIFIDEIDAVGGTRRGGGSSGNEEREQTLNQLLVEMDGFFSSEANVVLVAATNRPELLDTALLRPGRFDRRVAVDSPDKEGRKAILEVHARKIVLDGDVDFALVAAGTSGFSGAELANVLNEAALLAARNGNDRVSTRCIDEAIERVMAGPERKSRVLGDGERRLVAFHEAGHALVGAALPGGTTVHKVSIVSRGKALGYTLSLPDDDRFLQTRTDVLHTLAQLMGGRAAEEAVFGEPTSGAADDIERATNLAARMIGLFGMSEELGPRNYIDPAEHVDLSKLGTPFNEEVSHLLEWAHAQAHAILAAHRDVLDEMATSLIHNETLQGPELERVLERVPEWRADLGIRRLPETTDDEARTA